MCTTYHECITICNVRPLHHLKLSKGYVSGPHYLNLQYLCSILIDLGKILYRCQCNFVINIIIITSFHSYELIRFTSIYLCITAVTKPIYYTTVGMDERADIICRLRLRNDFLTLVCRGVSNV